MVEIKENVTYLIGAGASANATNFPINNQLINCIKKDFFQNIDISNSKQQFFERIYSNTLANAEKNGSLDLYARICTQNGHIEELKRIKKLIWFYFTYKLNKDNVDPRYKKLMFNILNFNDNLSTKLNQNVNILSWNYDLQIEEAIHRIDNSVKISHAGIHLNALPNMLFQINSEDLSKKTPRLDDGSLVHLNGVAGYIYNRNKTYAELKTNVTLDDVYYINKELHTNDGLVGSVNLGNSINFAWEENPDSKIVINHAINIANNTNHLVIIGYSFPEFNKAIDEKIIHKMTNLKSITFQTQSNSAIEKLSAIILKKEYLRDIKIKEWGDYSEFYSPSI